MSARRVIIDCDPGVDDAVAIALCGASREFDLIAITTTFGNVALEKTTQNALAIVDVLGLDVPVFAGADRPLVRDTIPPYANFPDGLGGVAFPPARRTVAAPSAVAFMTEAVLADPGNVSIVGIGPLTNIALAMRLEPRFAGAIRDIVVMGGAIGEGNKSAAAESNALADPHAMRIVFESGVPITMFGLDVTHKVLALPHRLALFAGDSTVMRIMRDLMVAYRPIYQQRDGWEGQAVHDMCTIAWMIDPELFTLRPMTVRVDTNEGPNYGRTVCDRLCRESDVLPTIQVAYDARADDVFDLLARRLATYERSAG